MRTYLLLGAYVVLALVSICSGCTMFAPRPPSPPPFAIYHAPSFDMQSLQRILLMPLANESPFPCAADEIRNALAAELQCIGPFEVVVAPPTPEVCQAVLVHVRGRFEEAAMLQLARTFKADAILVGAVTQYHPYTPPYIGLSVHLISPATAVVVASVDGLWDGRDRHLAKDSREYYGKTGHPALHPRQESDVGLASPRLFQRFVCNQVAHALVEGESMQASAPSTPPEGATPSGPKASAASRPKEGATPSEPQASPPSTPPAEAAPSGPQEGVTSSAAPDDSTP